MDTRLKSRFKIVVIIVLIILIGGLTLLSFIKILKNKRCEEKITLLPEFELTDINGKTLINHNNILSDRRTLN